MKRGIAALVSTLAVLLGVLVLGNAPVQADEFADVETIVPARLLDTRTSANAQTIDGRQQGGGLLAAGAETQVQVTGRAAVPNGATAAIVNITGIQATDRGFITAYPCGSSRPLASTLNYQAGSNIANSTIIAIGTAGRICIYNSSPTDLAIDITGYIPGTSDVETINPARLFDTRTSPNARTVDGQQLGTGVLRADEVVEVQIHGRAGVPGSATAAIVNITGIQATDRGFITAYPCGSSRPLASTLNYQAASNIANSTIIAIGTAGRICIYNSSPTDLAIDITGYIPATSDVETINPARLLDSRATTNARTVDGLQQGGGIIATDTETQVQVTGRTGVPNDATAAIVNITGIQATDRGFITAYPCGSDRPLASTLNYQAASNIANSTIIAIGTAGKICIYNSSPTDLAIDLTGYIPATSDTTTPPPPPLDPGTAPSAPREFANAGVDRLCFLGEPNVQCDVTPFNGRTDGAQYPTLTDPSAVGAGRTSSCVSVESGEVFCFGNNSVGQLGDGTTNASSAPVEVSGIDNARDVDAGLTDFACSALTTGQVKCWGQNDRGQLGNGTTANSSVPVLVRGIDNAIAVSAGATSACALLGDRTVSCWGTGLLGNGRGSTAATATPVLGLTNVTMISVGGGHACAAIDNNSVACWGSNTSGQIGNGTRTDAPLTSVANGLADVVAVSVGDLHSCARRSNGRVACWGENENGQLGLSGSREDALTPRTDPTVTGVEAVSTGTGFSAVFSSPPTNGSGGASAAEMAMFGSDG